MNQIKKAEALLEIIADELNVKKIVLAKATVSGVRIEVEYKAGKIDVYRNDEKVDAPKTAEYFADKFLQGRGF